MDNLYCVYYSSPVGVIEIKGREGGILSILFVDKTGIENQNPIVMECQRQMDEYFRGLRKSFDLKFGFNGTAFQNKVWKELLNIPYGKTASYRDIAKSIGSEKAVRAVGSANSKNPLSIVVPCHRIIGSDGSLTGYAGGLWRKEWLLNHERKYSVILKEE